MSGQAEELQQTMAFFVLADSGGRAPAGRSAGRGATSAAPARAKPSRAAKAPSRGGEPVADIDESQFERF